MTKEARQRSRPFSISCPLFLNRENRTSKVVFQMMGILNKLNVRVAFTSLFVPQTQNLGPFCR